MRMLDRQHPTGLVLGRKRVRIDWWAAAQSEGARRPMKLTPEEDILAYFAVRRWPSYKYMHMTFARDPLPAYNHSRYDWNVIEIT